MGHVGESSSILRLEVWWVREVRRVMTLRMRYIVLNLWLVQIPRIIEVVHASTRACVGGGGSIELVGELQAAQISMGSGGTMVAAVPTYHYS